MLTKTRISRTSDIGRMGEAMARPGMDTRIWASLAIITKVKVDPVHGVLADVKLLPSEIEETARVSTLYAGNGFGLYLPVEVDDEVMVVAPSGDPDAGLVVVPRLWSAADPPPADAANKPTDLLLLAKTGATVRVATLGGGNIVLEPRGSGEVLLGAEDAGHQSCRGDSLQATLNAALAAFRRHVHQSGIPSGPTGPALEPIPPPTPVPPFPGVPILVSDSGPTDLSPNVKVK